MAESEAAVTFAAAPAQEDSPSISESTSHTLAGASNPLKRKQSPEPDHTAEESSKKARLSPKPAANNGTHDESGTRRPSPPDEARAEQTSKEQGGAAATSAAPTSGSPADGPTKHTNSPPPPTRRKSQPIDERKRGQRLFGAVLGALGQNASPALTRRRDIDLKQREKLRSTMQEDDGAREARLARLAEARRAEQRRFDERGMHIRHGNMRVTARSLRTETEPRLYYRPWQLRPEEGERIDRQVREVEETIERDKRAWERKCGEQRQDEAGRTSTKEKDDAEKPDDKMEEDGDPATGGISDQKEGEKSVEDDRSEADGQKAQDTDNDGQSAEEQKSAEEPGKAEEDSKPQDQPAIKPVPSRHDDLDDDDGGDEEQDVDGDDAVIY